MAISVRVRGIQRALRQAREDFDDIADRELRTRALQAFADVKLATPVDTGRARNSWHLSQTRNNFRDGDGNAFLSSTILNNRVFLTNGTPYIGRLNDGSSRQAPARFIETSIMRSFPGSIPTVEVRS